MHIRSLKTASYYSLSNRFGDFPNFFLELENEDYKGNVIKNDLYEKEITILEKRLEFEDLSIFVSGYPDESFFKSQYSDFVEKFSLIFPNISFPDLWIVHDLPLSFSKRGWDGVCINQEDSVKLKIPSGIYFIRKYLTHPYFEFVVIHELVHWIIAEYSKSDLSFMNIYEEGVCDLFTIYFLVSESILPFEVIRNLLVYNRSIKPKNCLWYQYWRSSLVSLNYFNSFGSKELILSIKKGRSFLLKQLDQYELYFEKTTLSENESIVSSIFIWANSISLLTMREFFLLENLIIHGVTDFTLKQVNTLFDIPQLLEVLNSLTKKSLLTHYSNSSSFFNPHKFFPQNLKFSHE